MSQEDSPREGNGNLLQYSCLKNPMDRGAWRATVQGIAKSGTRLSTHTHTHTHTSLLDYDLLKAEVIFVSQFESHLWQVITS